MEVQQLLEILAVMKRDAPVMICPDVGLSPQDIETIIFDHPNKRVLLFPVAE
jgi:hypothetical protein